MFFTGWNNLQLKAVKNVQASDITKKYDDNGREVFILAQLPVTGSLDWKNEYSKNNVLYTPPIPSVRVRA